jgi:hypothetical protein
LPPLVFGCYTGRSQKTNRLRERLSQAVFLLEEILFMDDLRTDRLSDREFIAQFEDCSLLAAAFHHRDHVRLAWLFLRDMPLLEAIARFCDGLKRFASANGKPDRYHETLSWAFLFLIHQRMMESREAGSTELTWQKFAAANADLLNWNENILHRYYNAETLQSDRAKKTFLLPDRLER